MNEKAPRRTEQSEFQKATMEGNIVIPRIPLGIVVFGAEHCLSSENPLEKIRELIAPIPLDENLAIRTKRANAQHTYHGVPVTLSNTKVREIQAKGNLAALRLIGECLGGHLGERSVISFDADGSWADAEMQMFLKDTEERLTPQNIEFLRKLVGLVKDVLDDPSVVQSLKERKALLSNWENQTPAEQINNTQLIRRGMNTALAEIRDQFFAFSNEQQMTREQQKIYIKLSGKVMDLL